MFKWDSVFEWGRRGSDRPVHPPAEAGPDRMLEMIIAYEQVDVFYQPLIEPRTGRVVGAAALARSAGAPSPPALCARAPAARLDERLSRLIQRKALRSAAVWEGPL